jgi:serine/threonine protein kinase
MQTRFGKYELKRPLGAGASGTVYLALDTYSRKEVALKVFDPKVLHDRSWVR